jgi:hypothetical protein
VVVAAAAAAAAVAVAVAVVVVVVVVVVKRVAANYKVSRHHSHGKWQTNTHEYLTKLAPIR